MMVDDSKQFRFYLAALRDLSGALVGSRSRADGSLPLRESLYRVLGTFAAGRGIVFLYHEAEKKLMQHAAKGIRGRALSLELPAADARALAASTRPFRVLMPAGGTNVTETGCRTGSSVISNTCRKRERGPVVWSPTSIRQGQIGGLCRPSVLWLYWAVFSKG
jgi:hypothetical protein